MDLNLLLARNDAEWRGAEHMMQTALSKNTNRLGLRDGDHSEIIALAVEKLLRDDCEVLRRAKPTKAIPFIRRVVHNTALHFVRNRDRRENRETSMDEGQLQRAAEDHGYITA